MRKLLDTRIFSRSQNEQTSSQQTHYRYLWYQNQKYLLFPYTQISNTKKSHYKLFRRMNAFEFFPFYLQKLPHIEGKILQKQTSGRNKRRWLSFDSSKSFSMPWNACHRWDMFAAYFWNVKQEEVDAHIEAFSIAGMELLAIFKLICGSSLTSAHNFYHPTWFSKMSTEKCWGGKQAFRSESMPFKCLGNMLALLPFPPSVREGLLPLTFEAVGLMKKVKFEIRFWWNSTGKVNRRSRVMRRVKSRLNLTLWVFEAAASVAEMVRRTNCEK